MVGAMVAAAGRPCDDVLATKAELHRIIDELPDDAVDGAGVFLAEIAAGRMDADQAWF
jgi:hypothetical protein